VRLRASRFRSCFSGRAFKTSFFSTERRRGGDNEVDLTQVGQAVGVDDEVRR